MWKTALASALVSLLHLENVSGQTSPLPTSGNALWYRKPATIWSREYLPVGNGYLGAMTNSGTTEDLLLLNIDTLWNGGPFQNSSYSGGNKPASAAPHVATALTEYRKETFLNGSTADVAALTEDGREYGSFSAAGYLVVQRNSSVVSNYIRWLDLDKGIISSRWKEGNTTISRETFCSFPAATCAQKTTTSGKATLSQTYHFRNLDGLPARNISCSGKDTITLRGTAGSPGMLYEFIAKVKTQPAGNISCSGTGDLTTLRVTGVQESTLYWVGGTEYNMDAGTSASGYSFKGPDPHNDLVKKIAQATAQAYPHFYSTHTKDVYDGLYKSFSLNLGISAEDYTTISTDERVNAYDYQKGDPRLEWLLFQYGRYLLFSSARGVVPANLQGVWSKDPWAPWSGDYHANINTQENYWSAEPTGLDVTQTLWDYMQKTWLPRGSETAKILYNTTRGWVTHNEMNIFGATGMKAYEQYNTALWANYPAAGAWMMQHVWDHFDYGAGNVAWLKRQGYPLLRATAEFWLDNLFEDTYFNDGSLVVTPCNSPEQELVTFGCTHYQQYIWELFSAVDKASSFVEERDVTFLNEIRAAKAKIDRGLHVGRYGQLQEFKLDRDSPTDTHRHLSHLTRLYPSYSIASFASGQDGKVNGTLTRQKLFDASAVALRARGNGTGADADAGWGKVWRAASWAELGDQEHFYKHLKWATYVNFAANLFSLYNPHEPEPIFQFEANGAYPAAVINALIQAPDTPTLNDKLEIHLLPALPPAWANGSLKGVRLRAGISADLEWSNSVLVKATLKQDSARAFTARETEVYHRGKLVKSLGKRFGHVRIV